MHGTCVAGILSARRGSLAPAICPGCTLLLRPIFAESSYPDAELPTASPEELAQAIIECVDAGAHVLNVSSGVAQCSRKDQVKLGQALDYAAHKGVVAVAAAGNQRTVGGSCITNHNWVIPVVSCDRNGLPTEESTFGRSIGLQGLRAPGQEITSLGPGTKPFTLSGTSAACAFVAGAFALLWSEHPRASAAQLKLAATAGADAETSSAAGLGRTNWRRKTIVPPLLDAMRAYQVLSRFNHRRQIA